MAPVVADASPVAASLAVSLSTPPSGATASMLESRAPDAPSRRGTVPNLIVGGLSTSPRANMPQRKQSIRARELTKSDSSRRFTVVTSAAGDSVGEAGVVCCSSLPPGPAGSNGACPYEVPGTKAGASARKPDLGGGVASDKETNVPVPFRPLAGSGVPSADAGALVRSARFSSIAFEFARPGVVVGVFGSRRGGVSCGVPEVTSASCGN
mmetsp:Transcript_56244/g.111788  ORF Transcript_56244/g.111788 Transcript_56244/m.111788 type:complete len:210 (+) Transcript_56244:960-1589(+)